MSLAPREGQEDLFTLMMAQIIKYKPTVISRESTSAVLVTLRQLRSCKLASPPAVTPGHCQHRSVSLIMVTAREAANTPTGAAAGPHEPPAQRQNRDRARDAFCCIDVRAFLHKQTCKRVAHEQPGMIRSGMNHAILPHGVDDSDFSGAPMEESYCGGKGADTPGFLKETWQPKQLSDFSLGSKASHLRD